MPYVAPGTVAAGDVYTAAAHNIQVANVIALRAYNAVGTAVVAQTFTTSSNTYVDVTGMSVTITPTATSSRFEISVTSHWGSTNVTQRAGLKLTGGNTSALLPTAGGSRQAAIQSLSISSGVNGLTPCCFVVIDSPATISAITYQLQIVTDTNPFYLNRGSTNADAATVFIPASYMVVREITA